jgi:hypothetical protein
MDQLGDWRNNGVQEQEQFHRRQMGVPKPFGFWRCVEQRQRGVANPEERELVQVPSLDENVVFCVVVVVYAAANNKRNFTLLLLTSYLGFSSISLPACLCHVCVSVYYF